MPATPLLTRHLLILLVVLAWATRSAAGVTDEQVDAAIGRMQQWLLSQQDAQSGEWVSDRTFHQKEGHNLHGEHVMVTYALLASGMSPQDPRLDQALDFLREHELRGTYPRGVSAHIWAGLSDRYLPNLAADAEWLLKAQTDSLWDYGAVRKTRIDHSTTQYGILGLWEFAKRGGKTPAAIWRDAAEHFVKVQDSEGAWAYGVAADHKPRGSMTAAGLTVLYIAQQQLYRQADRPPRDLTEAIRKGLGWLDQHFTAAANPGGGGSLGYWLYGVERVGLAGGIKTFAGQDWFAAGAEVLLRREGGRGRVNGSYGELIETSFALLFLARGRVPVWITKLEAPGIDWNNRPNDIYFLTRYLSDLGEQEINWQTVSLDLPAEQYLNAPVGYLSSEDPLELNERQRAHLKAFIDRGGLLVASAEGGSGRFVRSVQQLAADLYPGYSMQPAANDHPLLTALYAVKGDAARGLQVVSNGARDLIFLTPQDWSRAWQRDEEPGEGDVWEVATNLYTLVTDRGTLDNRLAQQAPARVARTPKGEIVCVRARYEGAWDVEPQAWEPLETLLFNRSGYELKREEGALEDLSSSEAALVHLAGVDVVELTEAQLRAIRAYVEKGGTVLVETIGGRGGFSVRVEEQLQAALDTPATPLSTIDPILTGQGLDGGASARRVLYRPYSVIHLSARTTPRLAAFHLDGRAAIVISHEDLSLGAMGLRRWGVNGYQPESARQLLINVLLAAAQDG